MTEVRATDAVRAWLAPIEEHSAITDDRGTVIAYITPVESEEAKPYRKAAPLFDPEEIRQAKASMANGKGKTTAELLEYLRSPETP